MGMKLFESALYTLRRYADFSGRASRSEFWYFFAFVLLAQSLARLVDAFLGRGLYLPGPVSMLVGLALIVPQVAVAVRRLHDVSRSGRELLVPGLLLLAAPLVAMFGSLLGRILALGYAGVTLLAFANVLLLLARKGRSVPNRYGGNPTAFSFAR
jgi:uncharacterized membrane protein YhaH (DUF805 family)